MCVVITIKDIGERIIQIRVDENETLELSNLNLTHIKFINCEFCNLRPKKVNLSNNLLSEVHLPGYVSYVNLSNTPISAQLQSKKLVLVNNDISCPINISFNYQLL